MELFIESKPEKENVDHCMADYDLFEKNFKNPKNRGCY